MNVREQNWKNLCNNHVRDWHGIWTRYSPQGEVIESFQSLRHFQTNPEQTEVEQTNRYIYADGKTEEKSWEFNKQSNNLLNGLFHPQSESMRGLFFAQGAATWVEKKIETGSAFGVELFFRHEELRHSVGIVYDGIGSLRRTASVREDARGLPSKYWSAELNLLPERNLTGNWQGTSVTMTPDLKVSPPVPAQLEWPVSGNQTFFFPDGISLSCPGKVNVGTNFTIAANWLASDCHLQQITVNYDSNGALNSVTFEEFSLA